MGKVGSVVEEGTLFQMMMDGSTEGIIILDSDCAVRAVNSAFASMVGYSTEELLQMYPWDWDLQLSREEIESLAREKGRQFVIRTRVRRKDYTVRDLEINSTRIELRGTPHYFCICRDITAMKNAVRPITDGDTLYSAIFTMSPDGVVIIDATTHSFLDFNDAACQSHGYTSEQFARLTIFDVTVEPREKVLQRVEEIRKSGQVTFETLHRHQDGSLLNVRVTMRALRVQGKEVLVGFWTDFTHTRLLEEQLRQAQKMESVGQLAGGIAHDFNNVLTAIVGFAHMIERKLEEESPLRPTLQHILNSAERAAGLTRDLLTFSRKRVLDLRAIRVDDAIRRLEKILRRLTREDITVTFSCCADGVSVMTDESQFTHILMNLTTNARDAMPNGGLISICTSAVTLDESYVRQHGYGKPGEYALITFADTGCGMDEETRANIFEPFFTTKDVGKGTGLGLATVRTLVQQMEGFIEVFSDPGVGTVFRLYLPQCAACSVAREKERERVVDKGELPGGHETILLAEDDPAVRGLEEALLTEAGYGVLTAKDGKEALEIFEAQKDAVDLLVLDGIMPGKNGVEVLRQALKLKPDVKAILLSGYTSEILVMNGLSRSAATLLLKPVDPHVFLQTVREVLDRQALREKCQS